jgi:hypothetical protein
MEWHEATALAAAVALLAGCDEKPGAPAPTVALSGRVRLVGVEKGGQGTPLATRTVDDADGVVVHLERNESIVATTTTLDGGFQFDVDESGSYRALTWVDPSEVVATEAVAVSSEDAEFTEILELQGGGDVEVYPNPLDPVLTRIHYFLPVGKELSITVRDLALAHVRTVLSRYEPAGFGEAHWAGLRDDASPVTAGMYWVALDAEGLSATELVFVDQDLGPQGVGYGWTISASSTDPYVNSQAAPSSGVLTLYLWLVCSEGLAAAEFGLQGTLTVLATSSMNGFLNAGTPTNLLLATPCRSAPIVAASILVLDSGTGGTVCLGPSTGGKNSSVDCVDYLEWTHDTLGFSNDGSTPCQVLVGAGGFCSAP